MADSTGISWTDSTWNPTVGCSRVSPGCDGCYAIRDSARQVGARQPAYEGVLTADGKDWSGRINLLGERLEQPIRWTRPRRIFVNSMSDLFAPEVPVKFIAEVFATMAFADWHQFQVLTKRPQRMAEVVGHPWFQAAVERGVSVLVEAYRRLRSGPARARAFALGGGPGDRWATAQTSWPLPNVWLGTSIESQTYAWRAGYLLDTPAAIRFVSAEPLLGPLNLGNYMAMGGLDWVIVGGESGPRARPTDLAWIEALVEQCLAEGVAPFVKQLGHPLARALGVHGKGTDPADWPEQIRVQDWPDTTPVAVTVR